MSLLSLVQRRAAPGLWSISQLPTSSSEFLADHGWDVIALDLRSASDKNAILAALGEAGAFPDYYGHNWDAAYDCLTDLQWRPTGPRALLVWGATDGRNVAAQALQGVLMDATKYWDDLFVVWEALSGQPTLDYLV